MPRFMEFLAGVGDALGEHSEALTAAYNDDIAEVSSGLESATAKISELSAAREAMEQELTAAKAANWDLTQQIGAPPAPVANDGGEPDQPEDDEPRGIDSMFGE